MDEHKVAPETPQNSENRKKRPRAVTSCDNCIMKKIKFGQSACNTPYSAVVITKDGQIAGIPKRDVVGLFRRRFSQLSQVKSRTDEELSNGLLSDATLFISMFKEILETPWFKSDAQQLPGQDAEIFLDLMQYSLDHLQNKVLNEIRVCRSDATYGFRTVKDAQVMFRALYRLVINLSKLSTKIPSSLFVRNIKLEERFAINLEGGFADIFCGRLGDMRVALKRMRIFVKPLDSDSTHAATHRMVCQEALILRQLDHPYVLPFLGIDKSGLTGPNVLAIVTPWLENGSIVRYLGTPEGNAADMDALLLEIIEGIAYLHSERVIHGDIRGANILIDDQGHVKLADFGLAMLGDATTRNCDSGTHAAGSTRWMSPELLAPEECGYDEFNRTFASDVYAFACTCVELYSRAVPWLPEHTNNVTIAIPLLKGHRPARPSEARGGRPMTDRLWDIVQMAWAQQADSRPSAGQLAEDFRSF